MLKRRSCDVNIVGFPYFLSILFLVFYYSLCYTVTSYPFVPPPDNTHAERALRPAVISRKTSFGHRSSHGAFLQTPFMSLFQTWHIRHPDPLEHMRRLICRYLPSSRSLPYPSSLSFHFCFLLTTPLNCYKMAFIKLQDK